MLTETDIIKFCGGGNTFTRGKRLFRAGSVRKLECDKIEDKTGDFKVQMKAKVDGTYRDSYDVSLIYNDTKNSIRECFCTCPAYDDYGGICKHCVALAMEATNIGSMPRILKSLKEIEENKIKGEHIIASRNKKSPTKIKRIGKESTPGLQTILKQYSLGENSGNFLNSFQEKVKLNAIYHEEYGGKGRLEFKIGITQMYVLKNLYEFCRLLRNKENYSYGKKLEFVHTIEAFEEEAKQLIRFILPRAGKNDMDYSYYYYNYERYLYLEREEVNLFFDIMAKTNQSVTICRTGDYSGKVYQIFAVSGKNIPEELSKEQEVKVKKLVDGLMELTEVIEENAKINIEENQIQELAKQVIRDDTELEFFDKKGQELERLENMIKIEGEKEGITISIKNDISSLSSGAYPVLLYNNMVFVLPEAFYKRAGEFLSFLLKQRYKKCFISREDLPVFVKKLYPVLEQYFVLKVTNFVRDDYLPQKPSFQIYLDAPQRDMITCMVYAVYGNTAVPVQMEERQAMLKYNILEKKEGYAIRDWEEEESAGRMISPWFQAYDYEKGTMVLAEDEEMLYHLLKRGMIEMQNVGEVFVSDAVKKFTIQPSSNVTVGISLSGDILSLQLQSEMPLEELAAVLSKYDRKKNFVRLKDGQFIDIAHEGMETLYNLKKGLMLTDSQIVEGQADIPKYRVMYLDQTLKNKESISTEKDRAFRALVRNMKTVEDSDFEVPDSLHKVLRKYQNNGFLWIKTLYENGFGGLLADDMGLGKTLQVIAFLLSEFPKWKDKKKKKEKFALIVCPASLVYNWKSEIERFAPELFAVTLTGSADERKEALLQSDSKGIYIVSYDLLRRDIEEYKGFSFGCQIIDEAQYIKVSTTQKARSVKKIKAGFKLALTGTPVENRLSELWSIFDYLMPGFLYTYAKFRDEMESPIVQKEDKSAMERLQKMIRPFILRRVKKDVLKDLPDKIEENVFGIMEGEQKKLYEAHVQRLKMFLSEQNEEQFNKSKIQVLAELTKLRQLCCDPSLLLEGYKARIAKLDMCMEMIENAVQSGHKILLFSQFTTMLEHLEQALDQKNISHFKLTGSVSKEKRAKLVEDFNKDDTSVFLISLKAGGTGLNLTAADIVIHYDPWWNAAAENQASDRAHRIGQRNVVTVYKLVMKDTIEESIIKLQEKKNELAEQVLSAEGMGDFRISREELLEIL